MKRFSARDFQSEVTNVHNDYRAKEGQNLRSLVLKKTFGQLETYTDKYSNFISHIQTWDETVARTAQNWANQCEFEHSSGYGQNLYIAGIFPLPTDQTATDEQMKRTVVEAVHNWMAEKPYYDYDSNTCAEGKMCGHYTQVS